MMLMMTTICVEVQCLLVFGSHVVLFDKLAPSSLHHRTLEVEDRAMRKIIHGRTDSDVDVLARARPKGGNQRRPNARKETIKRKTQNLRIKAANDHVHKHITECTAAKQD